MRAGSESILMNRWRAADLQMQPMRPRPRSSHTALSRSHLHRPHAPRQSAPTMRAEASAIFGAVYRNERCANRRHSRNAHEDICSRSRRGERRRDNFARKFDQKVYQKFSAMCWHVAGIFAKWCVNTGRGARVGLLVVEPGIGVDHGAGDELLVAVRRRRLHGPAQPDRAIRPRARVAGQG